MTADESLAAHAVRPPTRGIMARPWLAFALCHLWLVALNLIGPTSALTDVTNVYRVWMQEGMAGGGWVGVDLPWVYPILAAVPMIISLVGGTAFYGTVWLALVTLLDAAAFALLLRIRRGRGLAPAAWWLGFLVALGPISLGRIDAVTVPLALAGLLVLATRPALASALLTIGAWVKVWPAALLLTAVIARRGLARGTVVVTALGTTAVVVAGSLAIGSGANVLGFVGQQTGRGLQVESTAALYHLWRIVAGDDRYRVYDDLGIITFQVAGPGVDAVAAALTPIMVGVVLVVTLLGIRAHHRGASPAALMGPLSLALVAALIVTNKVGSPQYVSWFAVPIIVMLVHDRHSRGTALAARLGLVVAALTQLVFPYAYMLLIYVVPVMVGVITLRDLGEIALLGVAVMQLVRLRGTAEDGPARVRAGRAARGRASHAQPVAGAPAPVAAAPASAAAAHELSPWGPAPADQEPGTA
ncbi:glycosyltransferase 87 family protein [Clavibacter tessellarius]|uniref:glycosyltransferase 87 family protein n=1 Tax=Clavibacter tessellarius TaxID=31965 RepID=UPI0039E9AEC6